MDDCRSSRARRFDKLFRANPDPWDFATSDYERAKRKASIAALPKQQFRNAFEVGCATGYLTRDLALKCDNLVSMDVSQVALAAADLQTRHLDNVSMVQGEVPSDWPSGKFDLIVFSEILYFLSAEELAACSSKARHSLADEGQCLLVNWTGQNTLPLSGDEAVRQFERAASWDVCQRSTATNYRIDRFR